MSSMYVWGPGAIPGVAQTGRKPTTPFPELPPEPGTNVQPATSQDAMLQAGKQAQRAAIAQDYGPARPEVPTFKVDSTGITSGPSAPLQGGSAFRFAEQGASYHDTPYIGAASRGPGGEMVIDPEALTAHQMQRDAELRQEFRQRDMEPLQDAAQRSALELAAEDPLAKERLIGEMRISESTAPLETIRRHTLADEARFQAALESAKQELMKDPRWNTYTPEQQQLLIKQRAEAKMAGFSEARTRFSFRSDPMMQGFSGGY